MTKRLTLAGVSIFTVLALSGCGPSVGYDADPIGDPDNSETCYEIEKYVADWTTEYTDLGVYCPAEVAPDTTGE